VGPIAGIIDMRDTVTNIVSGGANAVLMHKGVVRCGPRGRGRDVGRLIHLSASTSLSPFPNAKPWYAPWRRPSGSAPTRSRSTSNLGDENRVPHARRPRPDNRTGRILEYAALLRMMYARGPKVAQRVRPRHGGHCARVGNELGADVVKGCHYTGDPDSFGQGGGRLLRAVVIAGGTKTNSGRGFLTMIADSVCGRRGRFVGRVATSSRTRTRPNCSRRATAIVPRKRQAWTRPWRCWGEKIRGRGHKSATGDQEGSHSPSWTTPNRPHRDLVRR
jgi:class I fructose-bisphosphate aldolase